MNRDEAEKWCYARDFFYCCTDPDGRIIYFDDTGTLRRKDPDESDLARIALENSKTERGNK